MVGMSVWSREEWLGIVLIAVGGVFFGFNLAAPAFVTNDPVLQSTMLCAMLLGAAVCSPFAAVLVNVLGRRNCNLVAEALCVAGAVACPLAASTGALVAARVVVGIGAGAGALCKPLYITETVSDERHGAILALSGPAMAVGILLALASPFVLPAGASSWILASSARRARVGPERPPTRHAIIPPPPAGAVLPAALFLIALIYMPESPYLSMRGGAGETGLLDVAGVSLRASVSGGLKTTELPAGEGGAWQAGGLALLLGAAQQVSVPYALPAARRGL